MAWKTSVTGFGTYRERLRLARPTDRSEVGIVVSQLEARLQVRRAELA